MERHTAEEEISTGDVLRLTGIFTMVFSIAAGLVSLLVPAACSIVGGIQLILLGTFFFVGVLGFLAGTMLLRRRTR